MSWRHLKQHAGGLCECGQDIMSIVEEFEKFMQNSNGSAVDLEDAVGCILHKGKPPGLHECSKCGQYKDNQDYCYYKCRADKNGYLMRTNALCNQCKELTSKERRRTLSHAKSQNKIPPRPSPGDKCPQCKRKWGTIENPRNWHRDHDAIKNEFRRWLCGDCNMANHDHRYNIS
jgi:hypothetical protein